MATRTNSKPQTCERCGYLVPAGKGSLEYISQDWLDDNDDFETTPGWKVKHLDKAACDANMDERAAQEKAAHEAEAARRESRKTVLQRMLSNGMWADVEPERIEYFVGLVVERGVWCKQEHATISRDEVMTRLSQSEEFAYGDDWYDYIRYAR